MTTYFVTGTARGIGLEYVRQILAAGDRVHAAARRISPALADLAATAPDRCTVHRLDVADSGSFYLAVEAVSAAEPHLDVLVNNAGVYSLTSGAWNPETTGLQALAADDLLHVFNVNSVGPLLLAKAFLPLLARAPRGRIVNISSLLGSVGHKTSGADYAYCASKAALNIMTRALAVDVAPQGIVALAMTPGWVQTDMGGSNALLTPEASVRGMLGVIARMTASDAGRFVDQDGVDQPW